MFKCELFYTRNRHLSQVYTGFQILEKNGLIKLKIKKNNEYSLKPVLKVIVNNRWRLIYDTLDGFNWIDGDEEQNLKYFKSFKDVDFYFKRSYNDILLNYKPNNTSVLPLGLFYYIPSSIDNTISLNKSFIKDIFGIIRNIRSNFNHQSFEYYPLINECNKILFLARLWNPNVVDNKKLSNEREVINNNRINYIRNCRQLFGNTFIGGIQKDTYSIKHCPDLILSDDITNRKNFLDLIKEANICIATTGLHDSIGGKFGEYVAASRAVITEPLKYKLPEDFDEGENYISFTNTDQFTQKIIQLIDDKKKLENMMNNNYKYYFTNMRPDIMILNTLMKLY